MEAALPLQQAAAAACAAAAIVAAVEAKEQSIRSADATMAAMLQKDPMAARRGRVDSLRSDGRDKFVIGYREAKQRRSELGSALVLLQKKQKEVARAAAEQDAEQVLR
tara:strand:+ start:150 stop:473 length:324 start_codon:yes stop_codon:yes gene_type:complete